MKKKIQHQREKVQKQFCAQQRRIQPIQAQSYIL